MIDTSFFYGELLSRGIGFFTGVPDSLLKSFCAYISDNAGENNHIIAVNEGAAVALAAGFHLATGKIPLVYMQNSGIGNAVNPLLSLADPHVYRIPMLLVAGWRGEPGVHDEPQHITQGRVTSALFDAMDIPHSILSQNEAEVRSQLDGIFAKIAESGSPYALIVRKDTFSPYSLQKKTVFSATMSREEAIETIILYEEGGPSDSRRGVLHSKTPKRVDAVGGNSSPPQRPRLQRPRRVFVSTTGMASRELYELREKHALGHESDFLTVGSMGHAASIALGIALQKPELSVTCIDGDGASLMHLGAIAAIGEKKPANFRHIILNNAAHDSVGGQPTIACDIDLCAIARAAGYAKTFRATTKAELIAALSEPHDGAALQNGATFIEVRVRRGARADLGRPQTTPEQNKTAFMEYIQE